MRVNSKALQTQEVAFDGSEAGEGLAIFFSQNADATSRWRFLVKAMVYEGVYDVGEFYSSPPGATNPTGRLSRMIAGAICPGATSWVVQLSCVGFLEEETLIVPAETADIILASSKCCTSPVGVSRVGERYKYHANSGTQNFTVLAGMKVTGIAAIGIGAGGTVVVAGGDTITVPLGVSINLAPERSIPPNSVIAFTSVDWVIEYLESA